MRFEAILAQWENYEMSRAEAASVSAVSERTLPRWCQRYKESGLDGLLDRRDLALRRTDGGSPSGCLR